MSLTTKQANVSRAQVWAVLADGSTYADWVVGAKAIRAVSPEWPAEQSRIHHTVGAGPGENKDDTVVVESRSDEHIKLRAHFRPLGIADITIDLQDAPGGCTIAMNEVVVGGIGAAVPQKIIDLTLHPRNRKTLQRLVDLAAHR